MSISKSSEEKYFGEMKNNFKTFDPQLNYNHWPLNYN